MKDFDNLKPLPVLSAPPVTKWEPLPLELMASDYIAFELYRREVIILDEFVTILKRLEGKKEEKRKQLG